MFSLTSVLVFLRICFTQASVPDSTPVPIPLTTYGPTDIPSQIPTLEPTNAPTQQSPAPTSPPMSYIERNCPNRIPIISITCSNIDQNICDRGIDGTIGGAIGYAAAYDTPYTFNVTLIDNFYLEKACYVTDWWMRAPRNVQVEAPSSPFDLAAPWTVLLQFIGRDPPVGSSGNLEWQCYSIDATGVGYSVVRLNVLDSFDTGYLKLYEIYFCGDPSPQSTHPPSPQPTTPPIPQPTHLPTMQPTTQPTSLPTPQLTTLPSLQPTPLDTTQPTTQPTPLGTTEPTPSPTVVPTLMPQKDDPDCPNRIPTTSITCSNVTQNICDRGIDGTIGGAIGYVSGEFTSYTFEVTLIDNFYLEEACYVTDWWMRAPRNVQVEASSSPDDLAAPWTVLQQFIGKQPPFGASGNLFWQCYSIDTTDVAYSRVRLNVLDSYDPGWLKLYEIAFCGDPGPQPTPPPTPQLTPLPTMQPTLLPTTQPTTLPTTQPTTPPVPLPTTQPTLLPTTQPTTLPTTQPTTQPTPLSTTQPTAQPTPLPTTQPTPLITTQPTPLPSLEPTPMSTTQPTPLPTTQPTPTPTVGPTQQVPEYSDGEDSNIDQESDAMYFAPFLLTFLLTLCCLFSITN